MVDKLWCHDHFNNIALNVIGLVLSHFKGNLFNQVEGLFADILLCMSTVLNFIHKYLMQRKNLLISWL
jgi:hypothetical protein